MPSTQDIAVPDRPELENLDLSGDPDDWPRVRVLDSDGKIRWRKLYAIEEMDVIETNDDGEPFLMRGSPGRKPRPNLDAVNDEAEEIMRRKEEEVKLDPIVKIVNEDPDSPLVLNALLAAIAEESASLRSDRREAERRGTDPDTVSSLSVRRINALKGIGDTWLRRKEQVASSIVDMDSPSFAALFGMIIENFTEAMASMGTRPEQIDAVIGEFSKIVDDPSWKVDAQKRMKKASKKGT